MGKSKNENKSLVSKENMTTRVKDVLTLTAIIEMISDTVISLECNIDNLTTKLEPLAIEPFEKPNLDKLENITSASVSDLGILLISLKCLCRYVNDINEKLAI